MPARIHRVWAGLRPPDGASITCEGDDYADEMLRLLTLVIDVLRDAGAGILLGTHTDNAYVVPGHSAHEELARLIGAGLTAFEAIAAGTRDAAGTLGLAGELGTIAVGKRADLLIVAGDPLTDVTHLRDLAGVMTAGPGCPRASRRPPRRPAR